MKLSSTARQVLRSAQRLLPASSEGVLVLAYHLVEAGTSSAVDLPLRVFRRQIGEIVSRGRPSSLRDVLAAWDAPRPTASSGDDRPRVVVTFDDAHENFHGIAWPILRDAGVPVTLYVPTGFIDGEIDSPIRQGKHLAPMSWETLDKLVGEPLLTIGSHGRRHLNLARATYEESERELTDSRRRLESRLGIEVDSYCYPEGGWTPAMETLVSETYRSAVVAGGGRARPRRTRWTAIPRVPIRRDMPESLDPVLRAPVWLEERLAATVRSLRWRRDRQRRKAAGSRESSP